MLKVFVSLPEEIVSDYERLKSALLSNFVNSKMFRRKFRKRKYTDNESSVHLSVRMEQYFEGWVYLSNVDKNRDTLKYFMTRE